MTNLQPIRLAVSDKGVIGSLLYRMMEMTRSAFDGDVVRTVDVVVNDELTRGHVGFVDYQHRGRPAHFRFEPETKHPVVIATATFKRSGSIVRSQCINKRRS